MTAVPQPIEPDVFQRNFLLQARTQRLFYRLAVRVAGPLCPMGPISPGNLRPERNVFSTFFLAVTESVLGGSDRYLPLYAMVNQSMRAWVTACDNLLDDEDKDILPLALGGRGPRMRSVLVLMIADRVLTEYVAARYGGELLKKAGRVSLAALLPSATQECEEESGCGGVLPPEVVLDDIHARKTGDLFCAPLALPEVLESPCPRRLAAGRETCRQFGLACQILDDIKDMPLDLRTGRHNLVASLAIHRRQIDLPTLAAMRQGRQAWQSWERFAPACAAAWMLAMERFDRSFGALEELGLPFSPEERRALVLLICQLLGVPGEEIDRARGRKCCG